MVVAATALANRRRRMWSHTLLTTVLLIVVVSLPSMIQANPLNRLLMRMNNKNNKGMEKAASQRTQQEGTGESTPNQVDDQSLGGDNPQDPAASVVAECIAPETLQEEQDRHETEVQRLSAELQTSNEEARKWKDIKQDLVHQMARLQSQTDKELSQVRDELTQVRDVLEQKEVEFKNVQSKWEESTNITNQLAEQRVHETETLWKKEMEIAQTNAQLELQQAVRQAEQQCQVQIQEKLDQMAQDGNDTNDDSKNSTEDGHSQNCATLLGFERVKVQMLEEETSSLETQMEAQKASMQQLIDQMEGQYQHKFQERERELKLQWDEKLQAFEARDVCQAALEKANKKHDIHLTKTMELCDSANEQLEQEKSINVEHVKKQDQLEEQITELKEELAQLNQQKTTEKEQAEQQATDLKQMHSSAVTDIQTQHATAMARLQTQHGQTKKKLQTQIATLELDIDTLKKRHAVELAQTELRVRTEITAVMDTMSEKLQQEIQATKSMGNQIKTTLEQEIDKTKQALSQHETTLKQRNDQVTQLTRELQTAKEEVEYWEQVFGRRSYFNWTHVQDDALYWMGQGYQEVEAQWMEHVHQPVSKKLKPYQQKYQAWYRQHLKHHVDPVQQSLSRTYQRHVAPQVLQFETALQQQKRALHKQQELVWKKAMTEIRNRCPRLQAQSPSFVRTHFLDQLCETPDTTLRQILIGTALLLILLLRNQIWRAMGQALCLVWRSIAASVRFVFQTIWFLSPIRLLIPTKKNKKQPTKPAKTIPQATNGNSTTTTTAAPTTTTNPKKKTDGKKQ